MKKKIFATAFAFVSALAFSQTSAPTKRGLCYNGFDAGEIKVLAESRVSWGYNWYQESGTEEIGPEKPIEFMPMIWGANKDFDDMYNRTREYLATHPGVKCILGFNEPMMKEQYGGCDLTPKDAAAYWPKLEALAKEFNAELAGPALTWGFEPLTADGKIYGAPEIWMDEFIKQYKKKNKKREPRFDYVVLHSYMDYPSAVMWFCNTYGQRYGKKVLLTEFCAWDQDPNQKPHQSEHDQRIALSQKVEAMDAEDIVEGYAWFMSHGEADRIPFNSLFTKRGSNGELTDLGKVYLYMADVKNPEHFTTGQTIPAYLYSSSSNYNKNVGEKCDDGIRFNTPVGLTGATDKSDKKLYDAIPLELADFSNKRFANYLVNVKQGGTHQMNLRLLTDREEMYIISVDGNKIFEKEIPSTNSAWKTVSFNVELPQGEHEITISTVGNARTAKFYWFNLEKK